MAQNFTAQYKKSFFAHYLNAAVSIESGDLNSICAVAKKNGIAVYLGCAERAGDRGGHSIYCSLLYIDKMGIIQSIHRKLMPTYEERLAWSIGDGGSCISAPDGSWVIEPIVGKEAVITATISLNEVRKERQNFDPSGHYSRPDVFELNVNRQRQKLVNFKSE